MRVHIRRQGMKKVFVPVSIFTSVHSSTFEFYAPKIGDRLEIDTEELYYKALEVAPYFASEDVIKQAVDHMKTILEKNAVEKVDGKVFLPFNLRKPDLNTEVQRSFIVIKEKGVYVVYIPDHDCALADTFPEGESIPNRTRNWLLRVYGRVNYTRISKIDSFIEAVEEGGIVANMMVMYSIFPEEEENESEEY